VAGIPGTPESTTCGAGWCFKACDLLDHRRHVVVMRGELDVASRVAAVRACTLSDHVDVVVDMADVTFMDCAGYGAFVEARTTLEQRGGSLSLTGSVGEPLRLLSLIDEGTHGRALLRRADGGFSKALAKKRRLVGT